jgi:four helix bundle protein
VLAASMTGHEVCCLRGVPVTDFRDLVCWQLAYTLKSEILAFTGTAPTSRDFKFCDQIRDSGASAPRNIAEGFGRYTPRDFARFLSYARASLFETQNHLIDAHDRGYLDERTYRRLYNLTSAARSATTNLMRSKQRQAARSAQP